MHHVSTNLFCNFQRVFWALTEGATATALLVAGGKEGLVALQTAGTLSGLPFTFLVCLICVAIWRACKVAAGHYDPRGPAFAISLFDPLGTAPYSEISGKTTGKLFLQFAANIFIGMKKATYDMSSYLSPPLDGHT